MTRACEELGMIPLRVLLVRHNLAWAAIVLNFDESRLPHIVMHSQIACGRRQKGRPRQVRIQHIEGLTEFCRPAHLLRMVLGHGW